LTKVQAAIQRDIETNLNTLDNSKLSAAKALEIVDNLLVLFDQFEAAALTAASVGAGEADSLSWQTMQSVLQESLARWRAEAVDPQLLSRLDQLAVRITDLPGDLLGLTSERTSTIWIDQDAAGNGWSVGHPSGGWTCER
jgi:hypothetical protein